MYKKCLAGLWLLCWLTAATWWPITAYAESSALIVGPDKVLPGDLCVLKAGELLGDSVVWGVVPEQYDGRWFVCDSGQTWVFASRTPGKVYVFAAGVRDEKVVLTRHVLVNGEVEPDPDPEPQPDPVPPPPGKRMIVVLHESKDRTPAQAAVMTQLQAYLKTTRHEWRIADKDHKDGRTEKTAAWLRPYLDRVARDKLTLPVLLIAVLSVDRNGDLSIVGAQPLPDSVGKAVAFIKSHGG